MNPHTSTGAARAVDGGASSDIIKQEEEVTVKVEPLECLVCAARSLDAYDVHATRTGAGTPLAAWLARYSPPAAPPHVCRACLDLVSVLEQAELEYLRLRDAFEALLSRNPLFELPPSQVQIEAVKSEMKPGPPEDDDSEDEPLARAKKKRSGKSDKKKKKTGTTGRKQRSSNVDKYK